MEPKLILASSSPRRQEILKSLGIDFLIMRPQIDETLKKESAPSATKRLAKLKAQTIYLKLKQTNQSDKKWILAADTLVYQNKKIIGKPNNREEAINILTFLQHKKHKVVTGIALITPAGKIYNKCVITTVKFHPLNNRQIIEYIDENEWQDAAGGYKIQKKGKTLVKKIKGSYTNVMGLPQKATRIILEKSNFSFQNK